MKQSFALLISTFLISISTFSTRGQTADADQQFSDILEEFVTDGKVNYRGLKTKRTSLDNYLNKTSLVTPREFNQWSKNRRLAFLINVYNATTLQMILDHYPVKSIKDIGNIFRGPWKQRVVNLFGEVSTLDNLEHEVIRENFNEAKIHFALVCAAKGCPSLRSEAYTAEKLDEQLEDQAQTFLSNRTKNRINISGKTLYLSPIFDWYEEDFERENSSVQEYLQPYFSEVTLDQISSYRIRYTDYDWSLNSLN